MDIKSWQKYEEFQKEVLSKSQFFNINTAFLESIQVPLLSTRAPTLRDQIIARLTNSRLPLSNYPTILKLATKATLKEKVLFHFLQTAPVKKRLFFPHLFLEINAETLLNDLCLGEMSLTTSSELLKKKDEWLVRLDPVTQAEVLSIHNGKEVTHTTLRGEKLKEGEGLVNCRLDEKKIVFATSKEEMLFQLVQNLSKDSFSVMDTLCCQINESNVSSRLLKSFINTYSLCQIQVNQFSSGELDRETSEKYLEPHPLGTWLVRFSSNKNEYVLSVRAQKGSLHWSLKDGSQSLHEINRITQTTRNITLTKNFNYSLQ